MPSPEQPGGPQQDHEPPPYYQASRYQNERPAKKAYFQAQKVIFSSRETIDLSAYRFLLNKMSHVAVVGEQPPAELERKLKRILASGEPTTIPQDILRLFVERRAAAKAVGPWVEGHYRPGIQVYPPENGQTS